MTLKQIAVALKQNLVACRLFDMKEGTFLLVRKPRDWEQGC